MQFAPPEALRRYAEWRDEMADALAKVPPEAIWIDIGRADEGDFVTVSVSEVDAAAFR